MMDLIAIGKALDEFNGFLDVRLEKANRSQRAHAAFKRMLRTEERRLRSPVTELLAQIEREVTSALPKMKKSTPAKMADALADWDKIEEEGTVLFKPYLLALLTVGGDSVMSQRIVKQERFDPINDEAVRWTEKAAATLVTEVTVKTRDGIRAIIAEGLAEGESLYTIGKELKTTVGLTERYSLAVGRRLTEMLDKGIPSDKAFRMAERYANKLLRARIDNIVRTETSRALNEGIRQGYGQMGVKELQRVEDPDCCEICALFDGTIYTVREAAGVLPEHPSCEGALIAA